MPGPAPSVYSPFIRCGMPQANSTTSSAALDVALGVGDGLAVLAGQAVGELVVVAVGELQELHQHAGAALRVGGGPGRLRGLGVLDGGGHLGLGGQRHLGAHLPSIGW